MRGMRKRMLLLIVATASVLVFAAACSSTTPPGAGRAATTTAPTTADAGDAGDAVGGLGVTPEAVSDAPAQPSGGCTITSATAPGDTTISTTAEGVARTYRRYVPPAVSGGAPMPMVFNIHGLGSNIAEQNAVAALEPLAATEGFVVITPQGVDNRWDIVNQPTNQDLPFFRTMIAEVGAALCIDLARVYSTGISNGGIMSSILACQLTDQIAAIAVVSGIREPNGCRSDRPVPIEVFWGKQDVVLPFHGGLGAVLMGLLGGEATPDPKPPTSPPADLNGFPPVEQVVSQWAAHDGCSPDPVVVPVGTGVEERISVDCRPDRAVRFFVIEDGGHSWPGSAVMMPFNEPANPRHALLAPVTDQVDATAQLWAFFQGFALTS